ncbi:hypothetical protein AB0N05_37485 [Nocardia sp. NPDC051030]|uniref:hypothetical protein n=1 Tax=Nocardia sp. NPDC051030 TaxID=3155162 RepID=UPI003423D667
MDRRVFLSLLGITTSAPALHWPTPEPIPYPTRFGKSPRIRLSTVDELDRMNADLRRLDDGGGGDALLFTVRTQLRLVVQLLDHSRYTDATSQRLHSTAGELMRLAGWLAFDSGKHAHAERYWQAALRTAHTAGDRALAANTLGFMSCQAKDLGNPHQAVTLAESAHAEYPGASPRVSAILALRAAEAHATNGSALECRRAIEEAFTKLDSSITTAPDWSYWLTPGHAHGQAGFCYLQLGDHSNARRHFRHALLLQDPAAAREGTLRHTLLATTYVRQQEPDLDQALALAALAATTLIDDVTSTRCLGHLNTLVRELSPHHRRPAVRQFADQVHTATQRHRAFSAATSATRS